MYKIFKKIDTKNIIKRLSPVKKYYKCTYPSMSVKGYIDLLTDSNYSRGVKKFNIWFPEGYNDIDRKIKDVKVLNNEQVFFAIPNCDQLVSKYNVWKSLEDFYGREKASTIIPETFLLENDEHQKLLKEKNYSKIIIKKKKQRKEGLTIIKKLKEIESPEKYKDEEIAQRMVEPFLVNDRKINLRIYLMLTMKGDELNIYVSNKGTCIYTKDKYDKKCISFEKNITSYKMDLDIYNENPQTFNQLKTYLNDNNINYNLLFNKINEKIVLFVKSIKNQLGDKKFYNNLAAQVFGLDFIIDENLEPYLLECNKGPDMKPRYRMKENPDITDELKDKFNELKSKLDGDLDLDKLKLIKSFVNDSYKGLPKPIDYMTIFEKVKEFYDNEEELKSYPNGYKNGTGLLVQNDALSLLGFTKSDNNSFELVETI